jgi:N6-L-threonylcarbamoyladenine synthase
LLGLPYPGGPAIEAAATRGNPDRYNLPRAFLHDERLDFSFSGLKTAVLYALRGQDARNTGHAPSPDVVGDMAASVQKAVVDVLVAKTRQALRREGMKRVTVGGGVAANRRLRERLQTMAREEGVELFFPPMALCTDNAAMAGVAFPKLAAGQVADLGVDVEAGLVRPSRG